MTNEKCKIQTAIESVRNQALSECRNALDNAASALGELGIVSTFSMVANHDGAHLKILIDHIVNGSVEIEPCAEGIAPNARAIRAKLFDALVEMPLGMLASLATDQAVPFNEDKVERFIESDTPKKEKKFARKLVRKLIDQVSAVKLQAWLAYNGEELNFFEDDEPNVEDDLFDELMEFPLFYLNLFAEETLQSVDIPMLAKLLKTGDAIGDGDSERLQAYKQKLARCLAAELPVPVLDVWVTENESLKEGEVFEDDDDEDADFAPEVQTPADVLVSNLKATQLNMLCAHFNVVPKTKRVVKGVPVPTKKEMADAILAKHKPKKVEAALVQLSLPQFKL